MMLLVATPTMAQDCRAIQRACVASCLGGSGATGDLSQVMRVVPERVKACITRCSIAPCEQTPLAARLCDATAQRICNNGFKPVAMLAYPRPRRVPLRLSLRRRVRPSVAANSRHVWRSASATYPPSLPSIASRRKVTTRLGELNQATSTQILASKQSLSVGVSRDRS